MLRPKTTTFLNRLDPRQPSERDIYASANLLIQEMGYGPALIHARDKAIELNGSRQACVAWTRVMRAIKALWKPPAA